MEIRPARAEDAATLTAIAIAAKRHWGYPEHWIEIWTPLLTITPGFIAVADVRVAVAENEAAGFYALLYSGERATLEHFWVMPSFMGMGVGRDLLDHARARSRETGCQVMEIDSDPNAQGFYEKMGARKIGERTSEVDGQPRVLPIMEITL
jgi:ribosomal protein S18 acetylase RimI-like enzyme